MVKGLETDQINNNEQDSFNINDDAPKFVFSLHVTSINNDVPPVVTLSSFDKLAY